MLCPLTRKIHPGTISQPEQWKNPGYLRYTEDYTTQLYGDYFINHDIRIPSLTNQDSMESRAVFFLWPKSKLFNIDSWTVSPEKSRRIHPTKTGFITTPPPPVGGPLTCRYARFTRKKNTVPNLGRRQTDIGKTWSEPFSCLDIMFRISENISQSQLVQHVVMGCYGFFWWFFQIFGSLSQGSQ